MAEQLASTSTSSSSSLAYQIFKEACKSKDTERSYAIAIHGHMDYLGIPRTEYARLVDKDPKIIQSDICNFILYRKEKKVSPSAIYLDVAALKKFYDMNDVTSLNWKKIKNLRPEMDKVAEDRPYTHDEIKSLLDKASPRNKAIILLMSSTGMRSGAVPHIRMKDLEPIDKYNIYKITVYPNSKKSRYFSFCTPECRIAIDSYIAWRERYTERITDDTPLFRKDYDVHGKLSREVKKITRAAIDKFMETLVRDAGLRGIHLENQGHKRATIMLNHGFRKSFETNAFKAGMDHMYIRRLMGQKSGLEDSYLKLSEEELLEGDSRHVGYIGIIDQITIDDSQRLKRENQVLKIRADKVDGVLEEIAELKEKLGIV